MAKTNGGGTCSLPNHSTCCKWHNRTTRSWCFISHPNFNTAFPLAGNNREKNLYRTYLIKEGPSDFYSSSDPSELPFPCIYAIGYRKLEGEDFFLSRDTVKVYTNTLSLSHHLGKGKLEAPFELRSLNSNTCASSFTLSTSKM